MQAEGAKRRRWLADPNLQVSTWQSRNCFNAALDGTWTSRSASLIDQGEKLRVLSYHAPWIYLDWTYRPQYYDPWSNQEIQKLRRAIHLGDYQSSLRKQLWSRLAKVFFLTCVKNKETLHFIKHQRYTEANTGLTWPNDIAQSWQIGTPEYDACWVQDSGRWSLISSWGCLEEATDESNVSLHGQHGLEDFRTCASTSRSCSEHLAFTSVERVFKSG
jgi:hypothetical protein